MNSLLVRCAAAVAVKGSAALRELCGPLAIQLGDTDVDEDDEVNVGELDGFYKGIASLTRCSVFGPRARKRGAT